MASPEPRSAEPFLAWPGGANLRITIPLCLSFLKLFSSVYGGASLLTALRAAHPPQPYFPFELHVPFVPSMSAVYLTVPLALMLTPFILRTWRDITPFFLTLTAETLVAGLCFLLLPFAQAYPPRIASGFWGGLFHFADALNLDYNEVPSLHVTFAVTMALVFGRRCGRPGRALLFAWAVVVSLSTLLIHEHHLLGVGAGIVLAAAAVAFVERPAARRAVLDALRIEALCLREVSFFARRHPRYLLNALALWVHGLPRWRATRPLRAAWCLAQHVDDVLDGDRKVGSRKVRRDPEDHVDGLLRGMRGATPAGDEPEAILAAYVWESLDAPARADLLALFDLLRQDRRRMDARQAWSAAQLAEHHRRTFSLSVDLTLLLDGAELRAADVPELVAALAWCSPVRDLEKDLARGLINIPAEVLERVSGDREGLASRDLLAAPAVRAWLAEEHRQGAAAVAALGGKLKEVRDRRSREVLAVFHRALAAFERKYRRRHRDPTAGGAGLVAGRDAAR
jgi:hypothetical protein